MSRAIKIHFDGKVFVPDEPVDLPVGRQLTVEVPDVEPPREAETPADLAGHAADAKKRGTLADLVELVESFPIDPNSPGDAAAQHDHYLYGTSKRTNP